MSNPAPLAPQNAPTGEAYPPEFIRSRFLVGRRLKTSRNTCQIADESGRLILTARRLSRKWTAIAAIALAVVLCLMGFWSYGKIVDLLSGMGLIVTVLAGGLVCLVFEVTAICALLVMLPLRPIEVVGGGGSVCLRVRPANPFPAPLQTWLIEDAAGRVIASFRRNVLKDRLGRDWRVWPGAQPSGEADLRIVESPRVMAALRSLSFGLMADRLTTDYTFTTESRALEWSRLSRRVREFNCDVLDLSTDPEGRVDRRVAIALAAQLVLADRPVESP